MDHVVQPPESVLNILKKLENNGYDAYAVGGCIRDVMLGREPKDWDIATNALPQEVKGLFERTSDTGLKHGTVTVLLDNNTFEVTTFRIDGGYEDGRHPSTVEFTNALEEDLRRRDFTMNAMAWNGERGIVDPFGGREDIGKRLIRSVGEPGERFREDALRMLRAIRFAARLGFDIYDGTLAAIRENCRLIGSISSERIREELTGILTADDAMKFILLRDTGLLQLILPEIEACFNTIQNNPHHVYNVGEHSIRAVAAAKKNEYIRWTMLLHDTGKAVTRTTDDKGIDHYYGHPDKSVEIARKILKRLKFDNKSMNIILRLVKHHDRDILPTTRAVAKAVHAVGDDIFTDLLDVKRADKSAQNPADLQKGLEYVDTIQRIYTELKAQRSCLEMKDMAIDGHDLIGLGFREGKEVGFALQYLFEKVLENPSLNEKRFLVELAAELLCEHQKDV